MHGMDRRHWEVVHAIELDSHAMRITSTTITLFVSCCLISLSQLLL